MSPTKTTPMREVKALSADTKKSIRTFMDRWVESERANDLERLVSHYAEDAVLMPPNRDVIEGRRAALDYLRKTGYKVKDLKVDIHEIAGTPEFAFLRGNYSETFSTKQNPEPIRDQGKFFGVVRQQPDGSWLATHWTWNSNLPLHQHK